MRDWTSVFDDRGYVVLRGVLDIALVESAKRRSDELWRTWTDATSDREYRNLRPLRRELPNGDFTLDALQCCHHAVFELQAIRQSEVISSILEPRLGRELVSVVDTLFFKPPGLPGTGIAFHRDSQFRHPPEKFRDLNTKYVQVGVPLERHGAENGGLVLIPGSHVEPSIDAQQMQSVRGIDDLEATLGASGFTAEPVEMAPEDIILWHPQTIHGSPPNRSKSRSRRFYVVGYMAASCCDAGEPV